MLFQHIESINVVGNYPDMKNQVKNIEGQMSMEKDTLTKARNILNRKISRETDPIEKEKLKKNRELVNKLETFQIAITMLKKDHRQTASCGNSKAAHQWRLEQAKFLASGDVHGALKMAFDNYEDISPGKYHEGMLNSEIGLNKSNSKVII